MTDRTLYYVVHAGRLQDLLERAQAGEDVGALMTEEYEQGIGEQVGPSPEIALAQEAKSLLVEMAADGFKTRERYDQVKSLVERMGGVA